jgi:hypothetical protein
MKKLILEYLHKLVEDNEKKGYQIVPQDYSAEFRQTGSGRSMTGIPNKDVITDAQLGKITHELKNADKISKIYKTAWDNDEEGIFVEWNGKKVLMRLPMELRTATTPSGKPGNYREYFDIAEIGDGGFQFKLTKNGNLVGSQVQSRPDMVRMPNMGSATDSGYHKEYDDRIKYFFVKAGIKGKYQEEAGNFSSVIVSPIVDAGIKVRIIFHKEIMDFLTKDRGIHQYTSDKKGAISRSEEMEFEKKLEKIRKDVENKIKYRLSQTLEWKNFKEQMEYLSPEEKENFDTNENKQDFLASLEKARPELFIDRKESIGLPQDELNAAEKQRELIRARIEANRNRKK